MPHKVRLERHGKAGVIVFDAPPLNLIDRAFRAAFLDCLEAARAQRVERLVLTSACRVFVAGADAGEFGHPPEAPHLDDVLATLAGLPMPTVAALDGAALGGGCEIALACRVRLASRAAQLGLPEVTLGLVPGAGGTQRLPRLVGVPAALDMIVFGKVLKAAEALEVGAITRLTDTPLQDALTMQLSDLTSLMPPNALPPPKPAPEAIAAARATAQRRSKGQIAPGRAIDLIEASAEAPLAETLRKERAAFLNLRGTDQARALRHVFFAERTARARARHYPDDGRRIETACVVGGGTMGTAIAYTLARAGLSVQLLEVDDAACARARDGYDGLISAAAGRGLLSQDDAAGLGARLTLATNYDRLAPADMAIEAAYEDIEVKHDILARLEAALPETTILATNTSYLDLDAIAARLSHPQRFLGLHFFSPAHIMKLLEVVRAETTSEACLGAAFRLADRLGKIPVLSGVCDGFIGNRILRRYRNAADGLLLKGALPWEIDEAMRAFGMAMGPYETQDMSGLDIGHANRRRDGVPQGPRSLGDMLVEDHRRLGRKTGAGWYDYVDGAPAPSDLVAELVTSAARDAGASGPAPGGEAISTLLVEAMIDEARALLDEGIAETPEDVDLVLIHGYGFPRWRGGLMFHASESAG